MRRVLPDFTLRPRIKGRYASPATTWTRINPEGEVEARELPHFSAPIDEEPTFRELLGRVWRR